MSSFTASRGLRPRVATARVPRAFSLIFILLALSTTSRLARAQLVIEPPTHLLASSSPIAPSKPPAKKRPPVAALSAVPATEVAVAHHTESLLTESNSVLSIVLSSFDSGFADGGSIRADTSWVGNVTQNATSITVGGTARDENGWGVTGLSVDASAMNFLVITAQRDPGNTATTLFVQFEDLLLRTRIVSVSTSAFALGSLTTVTVPLAAWTVDFGPSQITGWSIGGGGVGTEDFRFTFDTLTFTASAIPEPSTTAALLGLSALVLAAHRRRRK